LHKNLPTDIRPNHFLANELIGMPPMTLIGNCLVKKISPWWKIFRGHSDHIQAFEAARYLESGVHLYTGRDAPHRDVIYFDEEENQWCIQRMAKWLDQMHVCSQMFKTAVTRRLEDKYRIGKTVWIPRRVDQDEKGRMIKGTDYRISLNTYSPSEIKPESGDVKPFLALLNHLCDQNDEYVQHLLNWMAWKVQHPTQKLRHAIVLGSQNEGTGKSLVAECLVEILGRHNCSTGDLSKVLGEKTNLLHQKQLVVIEEVRDMKAKQANQLKALISNDSISHELKFGSFLPNEVNYTDFIFTTNHSDALYAREGGRRYFFVFSKAKPLDTSFYDNFVTWKENGGLEALSDYLLNRPLEGFSYSMHAPITDALEHTMECSKSPLELAILEYLPDTPATTPALVIDILKATDFKGIYDTALIGKALKRLGYSHGGRKKLKGSKPTLYYKEAEISRDKAWKSVVESYENAFGYRSTISSFRG
jgi:Family of unknown function (DUF5906)